MKPGRDFIGVGVGAMVFNAEGKVLLTQRGPKSNNEAGKWDFPGGTVEFGESLEETVIREFQEELGILIEVIELIDVVNHILPNEQQHWVSPSYIARLLEGTPEIKEAEKCTGIKWLEVSEINQEELSISSRSNYEKYIAKYPNR